MILFISSLIALVLGYFIYGKIVERIIGVDPSRATPAVEKADGVDYMPMSTWRVFLIQFLNIAGVGPIFGAIMGVMYGPAAFLWIVLGTIFAGAVHDFVSAQISLRMGGKSLPDIVGHELGRTARVVMTCFSLFLLIMVVAVFVVTPAELLAGLTPDWLDIKVWGAVIFVYYILATFLPIDKLIGKLYPIFGAALLFMALGIMGYMLFSGIEIPVDISQGFHNRMPDPAVAPIFPMMFVSIACGAISGFHATQSPMMARCLQTEQHGRTVFYGAMVAEGVVALVWAAAAITYFGSYESLEEFTSISGNGAGTVVKVVCENWLGVIGGFLAILGVIAAPITTGDTAMRSARLIIADFLNLDQRPVFKRLLVALPIAVASFFLMQIDFSVLWRYFGWSNQTLSIFTLWACTVWLARQRKVYAITLVPALFMTVVCVSYILIAPLGVMTEGFGLPVDVSVWIGVATAAVLLGAFTLFLRSDRSGQLRPE